MKKLVPFLLHVQPPFIIIACTPHDTRELAGCVFPTRFIHLFTFCAARRVNEGRLRAPRSKGHVHQSPLQHHAMKRPPEKMMQNYSCPVSTIYGFIRLDSNGHVTEREKKERKDSSIQTWWWWWWFGLLNWGEHVERTPPFSQKKTPPVARGRVWLRGGTTREGQGSREERLRHSGKDTDWGELKESYPGPIRLCIAGGRMWLRGGTTRSQTSKQARREL